MVCSRKSGHHTETGRRNTVTEKPPLSLDLNHYFSDADAASIADANDILRPYTQLVPIKIEGSRVFLPDNNSLWRGMQFWGLMTGEISIDFGLFCIAGTCKNCKSRIKRPGSDDRVSVLACQTKAEPGIEIVRLAPGFVFRKRPGRPWDSLEAPLAGTTPPSV